MKKIFLLIGLVFFFNGSIFAVEMKHEFLCDVYSVHLIEINGKSVNPKMKEIPSDFGNKIKIIVDIIDYDFGILKISSAEESDYAQEELLLFMNGKNSQNVYENYISFKYYIKYFVLQASNIDHFSLYKEDGSFRLYRSNAIEKNFIEFFYGKCDLENYKKLK